jgi:alanyl-tRNA synthetase
MTPSPTERLYFADPYIATFRAKVVATDASRVALDRSAFYPEGGGQPADLGFLSQVKVVDVQSDGEVVWHSLDKPLAVGDVEGRIDWARRLDHMQQHHGQHLLSAAFERLFKFRTVSFHLGAQYATIDLSTPSVAESQAVAAEDLTNQVIWEDRPVSARFVTPEELATLPLRKPPVVDGAIRVVSVPDFDHSACGGTHPRSTGVVGLLHIRRVEKRGDGTRVEFVCGGRAARDLRSKNALVSRVSTGLTVGPDELEAAVGRLRDAEQATRKRLADAMERLASYEAVELVAKGTIIRGVYADRSLEDLKVLANQVVKRGGVALLGLRGDKAQLVFASPAGSPVNCGALLKEVVTEFGGKGGGQPGMAQGGLPDPAKLESALDLAMERIRPG